MTKHSRFFLFLSLAVIFLVAAPLTVFYSLGWRFDWKGKKIIQPGVFYFKVWPKSSQIYINGELIKKTDFFFGSTMVENLMPQKYQVEIKKDGFLPWQKTLEINERVVTDAKNIILVPEKVNFNVLAKNIGKLYLSPDKKKIVAEEKIIPDTENNKTASWEIKIIDSENNLKSRLLGEKDVFKEGADLLDFKMSPDSQTILLKLKTKEKTPKTRYYLAELSKNPLVFDRLDYLNENTKEVDFNPLSTEKLLFLESGDLKEANLFSGQTSLALGDKIITFLWEGNNLYAISESGTLFRANSSFSQIEKLNTTPFSVKKDASYQIIASDSGIFLKENDTLYKFSEDKKGFESFSESLKDAVFSQDSRKMAYYTDYEIKILFLKESFDQPYRQQNSQIFLTRFSEKIGQVFWLTNHYLLFSVGNKIKIAEIDDRDKINIFDIAEFEKPEIIFSQNLKKLFILTGGNFSVSDRLAPQMTIF